MDRAQLEAQASGITTGSGARSQTPLGVGLARAEILYRDHEYAEDQERSRREFDLDLERIRSERETENREVTREAAQTQANATREVAEQQIRFARAASRAAIAAAIAAFLSVAVTVLPIIKAVWFPQTTAVQAPSPVVAPTTHQ